MGSDCIPFDETQGWSQWNHWVEQIGEKPALASWACSGIAGCLLGGDRSAVSCQLPSLEANLGLQGSAVSSQVFDILEPLNERTV